MSDGCQRNEWKVSVAGDAVTGQKLEGNIPIVELIQPHGRLLMKCGPVPQNPLKVRWVSCGFPSAVEAFLFKGKKCGSRSPSPESTAWNSYVALGGLGNATGDGLVPVDWAHLQGAEQLTLKGCLHSINVAGTTRPTNRSFPDLVEKRPKK